MPFVSDYFHNLGLKFGIYSDAGYKTCGGMAASLGYEQQDMDLFHSFEIDYLKYDNCWPVVCAFFLFHPADPRGITCGGGLPEIPTQL